MTTEYVATLRARFDASDDASAILIAEVIREEGSKHLDDGDSLDVTQVTSNALVISPDETIVVLKRARNQLIRSRVAWAVDLAREIDKAAWVLRHRSEQEPDYSPPYPVSQFVDVLKAILQRKENPLD